MEAKYTSFQVNDHQPSGFDEIYMQHSLLFADSLNDLRNIRKQLYSAAEFYEDSYHRNDHDQLLLESLKDYVSKALISTIDHLGSVTSKVNGFLDDNIEETFETNLRVVCIEQRLQTCQTYSDHEGLSQQSLVIQIPKYHKQYLLPEGRFSEAVQAENAKAESSGLRREHKERTSSEFPPGLVAFSFTKAATNKGLEKRSRSMSPSRFRIRRPGSTANQLASPIVPVMHSGSMVHRSIGPNTQKHTLVPRRSHSLYPERERGKDIEVYTKKTRNLFKVLLSRHKSKNDTSLYR
uniref:protein ABIL2-like isoform X2 n=1 Tax=Erigeron canadensis TaxID=72917 RepID=UPI001CB96BE6|nr:protein ABIL2-like isoform X2 [Erigeron canadensis]